MKKIAVLLDIPILHDGRVRRVVESLSAQNEVDLFFTTIFCNMKFKQ